MIDKRVADLAAAVAGIEDGATVLVGGFGDAGVPNDLVQALVEQGAKDLTLVGNGAISEVVGHGRLIAEGRVRKFIASFPKGRGSNLFEPGDASEAVELEIAYAEDCLPNGILGLNADLFRSYVQYIADRRLERISLEKKYHAKNPFGWMSEAIDLPKEKNFFETRVTEYQSGGSLDWG